MKSDPKQIVTPYAFEVHPDLLGIPLATPKRRLLALLIDLVVAALLSMLGNLILAFATAGIFFWIAYRTQGSSPGMNKMRYGIATAVSLLILVLSLSGINDSDTVTPDLPSNIVVSSDQVDWKEVSKVMSETDFSNDEDLEALENYAEKLGEKALYGNDLEIQEASLDTTTSERLIAFSRSIQAGDTTKMDSLRTLLAANIAAPEISEMQAKNEILNKKIEELNERNGELRQELKGQGFLKTLRATGEDLGLTLGWVGIYFIVSLTLMKGQTPGKKLLGLKVVRLNNQPIGVWYSFERFGGYAAGFATGLLGFFQIFKDANRQGIHDKIAGTVVVDLREKKKRKFKDLTDQVRKDENLLKDEDASEADTDP